MGRLLLVTTGAEVVEGFGVVETTDLGVGVTVGTDITVAAEVGVGLGVAVTDGAGDGLYLLTKFKILFLIWGKRIISIITKIAAKIIMGII